MIRAFLFTLVWIGMPFAFVKSAAAQNSSGCDGYRYRYTGAFEDIDVQYDIPYGENINVNFVPEQLVVDIYAPAEDANASRPLILMAHGGFFNFGSNDGGDVVELCKDLAHMGYVVASMSYRLGFSQFGDVQTEFVNAVWRGVHDSRAAVRYFRQSMEIGNPYGIDTSRIFLGGVSAGGFIALHHAFLDVQAEIPAQIDVTGPGMGGGLEGLSGNTGYSSEVRGVFNIAGALQSTSLMNQGFNEPVCSVHGTMDDVVPFEEGSIIYSGAVVMDVEGSALIHAMAEDLQLDHCLIAVEGAGHVPHMLDPVSYGLTLSALAGKLGEWSCVNYDPICGAYDYTVASVEEGDALAASPVIFPNPALSAGQVNAAFEQQSNWQLVNALGQVLDRGWAESGALVVWNELRPGWYALTTDAGASRFIVLD